MALPHCGQAPGPAAWRSGGRGEPQRRSFPPISGAAQSLQVSWCCAGVWRAVHERRERGAYSGRQRVLSPGGRDYYQLRQRSLPLLCSLLPFFPFGRKPTTTTVSATRRTTESMSQAFYKTSGQTTPTILGGIVFTLSQRLVRLMLGAMMNVLRGTPAMTKRHSASLSGKILMR